MTESSESQTARAIDDGVSELQSDAHSHELSKTAGEMLRELRMAAGVNIHVLSLALKVPVQKLEALESDHWDQLPDIAFVRALATSICRHLKVDSALILEALPPIKPSKNFDRVTHVKPTALVSHSSPLYSRFRWTSTSQKILIFSIIFALAALLVLLWPHFSTQQADAALQDKASLISQAGVGSPALAAVTSLNHETPAPANGLSASALNSLEQNVGTVGVPLQASSASSLAAPVGATTAVSAPSESAINAHATSRHMTSVQLVAKHPVWVEVKDAKTNLLLQRVLRSKETFEASGVPPLSVVIGRVSAMESVSARGATIDLTPVTSSNDIARFEVR